MTDQERDLQKLAEHRLLLNIQEVCQILRVSRWTVWNLINQRKLTAVHIGRRRLVTVTELEAFVRRLDEEERENAG